MKLYLPNYFIAFVFAFGAAAPRLMAWDMSLGMAALEEGDDRQRPAIALGMGFNDLYAAQAYYWGRELGPLKETSFLIGGFRRFPIFPKYHLTGGLGMGFMAETLSLEYSGFPEENDKEENYNLGAALRFAWEAEFGPLALMIRWDSFVFPAGLNGGLFLATGRKQLISAGVGVRL
jgi:hypothetical protein